jgi:hypothetical protein
VTLPVCPAKYLIWSKNVVDIFFRRRLVLSIDKMTRLVKLVSYESGL